MQVNTVSSLQSNEVLDRSRYTIHTLEEVEMMVHCIISLYESKVSPTSCDLNSEGNERITNKQRAYWFWSKTQIDTVDFAYFYELEDDKVQGSFMHSIRLYSI